MRHDVIISSQFNGPPKSANGGYASGIIASALYAANHRGAIEVSLHVPPPLDKPLSLKLVDGLSLLMDGDTKVGTGKAATFDLPLPAFPKAPVLTGKPENPTGKFEPFDICFVCGEARSHGDGLCLHAERVEGHPALVAAPWTIHPAFVGPDGHVMPEFIWSALDCPGYFACAYGEPALLARFVVDINRSLRGDRPAYVYGWSLDSAGEKQGRKRRCGTAVIDSDGQVIARAEALWVVVDPAKIAS